MQWIKSRHNSFCPSVSRQRLVRFNRYKHRDRFASLWSSSPIPLPVSGAGLGNGNRDRLAYEMDAIIRRRMQSLTAVLWTVTCILVAAATAVTTRCHSTVLAAITCVLGTGAASVAAYRTAVLWTVTCVLVAAAKPVTTRCHTAILRAVTSVFQRVTGTIAASATGQVKPMIKGALREPFTVCLRIDNHEISARR